MRRVAGSIEIGDEDILILRMVLLAEFISRSQLFRLCRIRNPMMSSNTFKWRYHRLAKHGLIAAHATAYTAGDHLITVTGAGWKLLTDRGTDLLCEDIIGIKTFDQKAAVKAQHALGLNELHLLLCTMPSFRTWLSAGEIRMQNELKLNRYAKHYDAVACFQTSDGKTTSVAIELERSSKSKAAYKSISAALAQPDSVDHVLYILGTCTLQNFVAQSLRGCTRPIITTLHEQFLSNGLDAPALCTGPTWEKGSISTFLFR